jgi:hypothetical protein
LSSHRTLRRPQRAAGRLGILLDRIFKRTARRRRLYTSRQPRRGARARRRPLWPQPQQRQLPLAGEADQAPRSGRLLRVSGAASDPTRPVHLLARTGWRSGTPSAAEATLVTSAPRSRTFFKPTRPRLPGTSPATSSRPPTLQLPTVAIIARALTTLWRAQDSPQTRPRSLLSLMRLAVAFNVSYPKSEPPNQAASLRLCSVRTLVNGSFTTKLFSIRARPTFPTEHPTKRCLAGRESRSLMREAVCWRDRSSPATLGLSGAPRTRSDPDFGRSPIVFSVTRILARRRLSPQSPRLNTR